MRKLISIVLGWWFWATNQNNYLAQKRLKICAPCRYRMGMICGECGCLLQAKTRLKEEDCPRDYWGMYGAQK